MPIYEYGCDNCGHVFEEWQSGFEEREMTCPQCGGKAKRLISRSAFHLKGSGWYATEYGDHSGSSGEDTVESTAEASKPDAAGAASKAETTSATATQAS